MRIVSGAEYSWGRLMTLGAQPVTTTIEGRERYNVAVSYPQGYRNDPRAIATDVLIPTPDGGRAPLGEVATVSLGKDHP